MESKAKSPGNMSMVHCRDWAKQQYLSTEQIHKVKISDLQTSTPMSPLVLLTPGLGLLSSGKSAYKNLHSCGARGLVIVWLKFAKNKFKNSQKTRFSTINGRSRYLYAGDEKSLSSLLLEPISISCPCPCHSSTYLHFWFQSSCLQIWREIKAYHQLISLLHFMQYVHLNINEHLEHWT